MKIQANFSHECFGEIFNEDYRYIVYYGGRGSGKSWSIAKGLIIRSMKKKLRILCTRETAVSIDQSIKLNINDRINEMGLQNYFDITDKYVRCKITGSIFLFTGLKASGVTSVQSFEGIDIVWLEEAQSVSKKSWKILIPTIRKNGSQIIVSFNPDLETDPVYQMFVIKKNRLRAYVRKINYDENPYFKDTPLYAEMIYDKKNNPDDYNNIWLGDIKRISDAVVFKNKFESRDFIAPKDAVFFLGLDYGFSPDPTCIIRCCIDEDKRELYIDKAAMSPKIEIEDLPAFLMDTIPNCKQWLITVESANPRTTSYLQRQGFRLKPASKGKDSVKEGIRFLKNYKIIIHSSLKDVYREFSTYSYKVDKTSGIIIPELEDKNNHSIDALRYALEAYRKGGNFKIFT